MNFIDLHCDTAMHICEFDKELKKNDICIDIEKLKKGNALAQFFAMFIELNIVEDPYIYCKEMLRKFKYELEKNKNEISLCRNYDDLKICEREGKLGAFLTIEEGAAIKGDINRLREFKEEGISLITLTWNFENEIGYPNAGFKYKDKGLKEKGIEIVEEMNKLGMIIDVSHLSDEGFYDCIKYSKKPIIASHSNVRAMSPHPRNLTDEMLKTLANNGGVTGINFCSAFLINREAVSDLEVATIDDMIRHIKHMRNIAGIDVIALGSDFDGIENKVEIENAGQFMKLADRLEKEGFSITEIEKIFSENAKRIIKDVLI
ncbi:MAG: dipeptidase [Sarcina sp.]